MTDAFRKTPAPVIFLILCLLGPTELSLYLGDVRLPLHRVALILLFPFAILKLATSPNIRIRAFDFFFVLYGCWLIFVYGYHGHGISGFVLGGSMALEATVGYLVARAWVRDVDTMRGTLKVVLIAILIAALFALPETFFGKIYTHDFLAQLTGYQLNTTIYTRLGLTRAYGTFDHPIHYGTFCAGLFAMFWYSQRSSLSRIKTSSTVAGATFLSVSSAPLLCLIVQVGLITWEWLSRGIKKRTWIAIAGLFLAYLAIEILASRSPFVVFATRLTLDPTTGYYRVLIWEYGLKVAFANPIVGIGRNYWERPAWMASDTIDSFWLVLAMHSGLTTVVILVTAIALLVYAVNKRGMKIKDLAIKQLARGWIISLIALCFIGVTVHYWSVLQTYFFFFLGLGGAFADPKRPKRMRKPVLMNAPPAIVAPIPNYQEELARALRQGPQPQSAS